MMKEKYQTRLPSNVADEVDEFIDDRDISQAEGVRQLIERGLDADPDGDGKTSLWQRITAMVSGGDS